MTFDPRKYVPGPANLPWMEDPRAEPRVDLAPEERGPRKLERLMVTVASSNVFRRIERWLRS